MIKAEREALIHCEEVLSGSGSSFSAAMKILPELQRQGMTALYAYCRLVDDAVDEAKNPASAERALSRWRDELARIKAGTPQKKVGVALKWALDRFDIPIDYPELILEGVGWDISPKDYQTFADLGKYCYRVASAVGLFVVAVFEARGEDTKLYAELTGLAVQLTNILRDVREDAEMGRVYLPTEDMHAFGLTREDILKHRQPDRLAELVLFEARRTQELYLMARAALPERFSRRLYFAEAARETYLLILTEIIRRGGDVFTQPVKVPKWQKISIALKKRYHPATLIDSWWSA
jgi:15-cis-phytoene synthase